MTITAKFAATCPACRLAIAAGSKIEWSKGNPARHAACAGRPAELACVVAARERAVWGRDDDSRSRRGGQRTGCSCGSRDDSYGDLIPSSRNCASCEHDA